jgi:hypothetical protein
LRKIGTERRIPETILRKMAWAAFASRLSCQLPLKPTIHTFKKRSPPPLFFCHFVTQPHYSYVEALFCLRIRGDFDRNVEVFDSKVQHFDSNVRLFDRNVRYFDSNVRYFDRNVRYFDSNVRLFDSNVGYFDSNVQLFDSNIQLFYRNVGLLHS